MTAVIEATRADSATAVRERLEEFGREVLAEATNRPRQMVKPGSKAEDEGKGLIDSPQLVRVEATG